MLRGLLRHGDTYLARVLAAVSRSAKWLAHLKNMGATLLHEVLWRKACRWSRSGSTSLSTRLLKVAAGGCQTKLADPVVSASLYNVLEESSRETERRVVTDRRTREVAAVRTYSAPLVSVYLGSRAPQFVSLRRFYRFAKQVQHKDGIAASVVFRPGTKRVDVCEVCLAFKKKARPQNLESIRKLQSDVCKLEGCADYFRGFAADGAEGTGSHLRSLQRFCGGHREAHPEFLAGLRWSVRFQLHEATAALQHALRKSLVVVDGYEDHRDSASRQYDALQSLESNLPLGHALVYVDYKQNPSSVGTRRGRNVVVCKGAPRNDSAGCSCGHSRARVLGRLPEYPLLLRL